MALFSDVLLTADYDRTLTDPDGQVPQRNLEAIRYFMENGGSFTVNTGRSLPQLAELRKNVPMNAPFLCYNGSLAIDGEDRILFQSVIDLPMVQTLKEVCAAFPDLNVDLHGLWAHVGFQPVGCWQEYYAARKCKYFLSHESEDYGPFVKFNVYGQLRDDTFYQVFSGEPEEIARLDEAAAWLEKTYGDKLTFWGGISTQQTLPMGTPEQVRDETLRVTEYMARDGGYLIAAAQGIQSDVPFENLCTLVDTANEI